ncbi:hypothetical protein SERLA73DRAFT_137988, partial [Serpula lacrymans var. lacrymans S7.3]
RDGRDLEAGDGWVELEGEGGGGGTGCELVTCSVDKRRDWEKRASTMRRWTLGTGRTASIVDVKYEVERRTRQLNALEI